jgi:hypothetical protein
MRLHGRLPTPQLFAVTQVHKRDVQQLGVLSSLPFTVASTAGGPLRLEDGNRMPVPIAKHIVGAGAIGEHFFEMDGVSIVDCPIDVA